MPAYKGGGTGCQSGDRKVTTGPSMLDQIIDSLESAYYTYTEKGPILPIGKMVRDAYCVRCDGVGCPWWTDCGRDR